MSSNNVIHYISNSRKNILDILEKHQGYDTSDYKEFNLHEIDSMRTADQLDMLLQHKTENKKTYIKYVLSSKPTRANHIDNYVEDLYEVENLLTKNDTLIVILTDEPNDNLINHIKYLYNTQGIFIVINTIKRLQFNILDHELVPEMIILDEQRKKEILKEYNLKDYSQLPIIDRFDAQALAMSMRPGDIGCIFRKSVTALEYLYYRICV